MNKNSLFAIIVGRVHEHPYWKEGAFVALSTNDWGPSPTLKVSETPDVFLTEIAARNAIEKFNIHCIELLVVELMVVCVRG